MDAFSSHILGRLVARIREQRALYAEQTALGVAPTLEDYRERVGHTRALDEVLAMCGDIEKEQEADGRNTGPQTPRYL